MHLIDINKLESARDLIDGRVTEISVTNSVARRFARQSIAKELGVSLESEEVFGWWFATTFRESDIDVARQFVSSRKDVPDAVRREAEIMSRGSFQAATREDAETAALLWAIDDQIDLILDVAEYERLYAEHVEIHPNDIWTPWVEFYWDSVDLELSTRE